MHRHLKTLMFILAVVLLAGLLFACTPVEQPYQDPYPIVDGAQNDNYKDFTTKEQANDIAVGSLENLLSHLDSDVVTDTGYYLGADMTVNTEDGSAFKLRLQANLYTYPYEIKDEEGNTLFGKDGLPLVDPENLAKHNDIIRYSDIVLEWFDGASNEMLIGFYFDGINPNSVDDGNDLYLNLQGSKRIFKDFGDSVMYQQMIRLITQFNLDTVIGSVSSDGQSSTSMSSLRDALDMAITNNYKQTLNGEDSTIFYNDVSLSALAGNVTSFMQSIFAPFEDKLDPLTNKYLGFLFSTLGVAEIRSIDADMEFISTEHENIDKEELPHPEVGILRQLVIDAHGDSAVPTYNEQTGLTTVQTIPYQTHISAEYDIRTSPNIVFDKSGYTLYDYGNYEYVGDMWIPMLDLELDVLLRTDMNEVDNSINKIFMNCRDIATDDLVIGLYYTAPSEKDALVKLNPDTNTYEPLPTDEPLTFVDIQGLQDLYGGIAFEDIGLPKAYKGGFDLADTLSWLFDFIDEYIVIAVDNILYGSRTEEEDSKYTEMTTAIMDNITSTMKKEDDPSSRATIKVKIDIELIRKIMSINSKTGVEFTTEQIILMINEQFNIDLESIAAILGVSLEELIETTYFDITYDVDEYSIRVEVYSYAEMTQEEFEEHGPNLIMRMDLYPNHIGEYVRIVFPSFKDFNELQDVMTYSGTIDGQFIFASAEEVDLSDLLGSFMGDMSGLNTPFILPAAATIQMHLDYDQYIREQILPNGRWTRATRSAFRLEFSYVVAGASEAVPIITVLANDVSFNTADPIEEMGYVWLDYHVVENMPMFKVREDIFIRGFYEYMGYDFESEGDDVTMGFTDIVQALLEDSWAVFEPEVIRLTTSNQTIKDFFRVDELIGTIEVKIGFKQRVENIDDKEARYAMYTVGEFEGIEGESVYSTKLHDTIKVYFDFGSRIEERDFLFLYDPNSIAVNNGQTYYMPAIDNLFMGVTRDYLVRISTDIGKQAINGLVNDYYEWEPLENLPIDPNPYDGIDETPLVSVPAYYGDDNLRANYDAEFRLHAVYDRNTGYYTVLNDLGYEIVYDFENNLYVIGLGTQGKYDKAIEQVINSDIPYYYQTYENMAGLTLTYDLGLHKKGWYTVQDNNTTADDEYKILYNQDRNIYVVETEAIRVELLAKNYFGEPIEDVEPPKVYPRTYVSASGDRFMFDMDTGKFCAQITEDEQEYKVLYDYDQNYYFAESYPEALQLQNILEETRVAYSNAISFAEDFDWEGLAFNDVDWGNTIFGTFTWTNMDWEDITLEGGKFVVYVIIGDGMMATYRENVVVKVLNRTIDTNKYVNVAIDGQEYNVETGEFETVRKVVKAPVADYITIDPYAYLIYKAYFMNSGEVSEQEMLQGFVAWYFNKYEVTFNFTTIYNDPLEDTPAETGFFTWSFCSDRDDGAFYSEFDINNRHSDTATRPGYLESNFTYVHTVFHGQIIALSVEVLPRKLESAWIIGQANHNEYVVDALEPSTYTLPTDLVYFFEGQEGEKYVLNFRDYNYTVDDIPSLFSTLPDTFNVYQEKFSDIIFLRLLEGPNSLKIIKWANPVANNVKLEGNLYPFKDVFTDVTKANFDLANFFDRARNWYLRGDYDEGWFYVEEIALKVLAPDKIIGTRDYTFLTGSDYHEQTETVMNLQVAPYHTPGQTEVGADWGVYYVDPYDSSTWVLPRDIFVHFDGMLPGTFASYGYNVEWRNVEGDSTVHFDNATGEYYLVVDPNMVASHYFLEATIGSGENTMVVRILVQHMTGVAQDITFKMADGSYADGNLVLDDNYGDNITVTDLPQSEYQLKTYNWAVDTYARFQVPEVLDILFADGTRRSYATDWHDHAPWVQGTTVTISTTLGDAYSVRHDMSLTYDIEAKTVEDIIFNLWEGDDVDTSDGITNEELVIIMFRDSLEAEDIDIVVDLEQRLINLRGVRLRRDGLISFGANTNLMSFSPYDFFVALFSDITVIFAEDGKENIRIKDATTSAELPIFGTLDTQKLLEAFNGTYGQGVDIFVGQDDDADDFTVAFELEINDEDRAHIEFDEGQSQVILDTIELEIYNADNTFKYDGGYVIKDQLQFTITRDDGTVVHYGGSGAVIPETWTVAFPSKDAEDLFWNDEKTERMVEVYHYEQLSVISEERLKLGGVIWLSAMLPDSSRIYVQIASRTYDIGSNFHSAPDNDKPYDITYGTLVIDNLYDNYKLSSFLLANRLPSRIQIGDPSSNLIKSGIVWSITATSEELDAIDHRGTASYPDGVIDLAVATIMGKEVVLKLKVLPTEVMQLNYNYAQAASSRHFLSRVKQPYATPSVYSEYGEVIVVDVDAYHNWAYNGTFVLPSNINLIYNAVSRFVDLDGDGEDDGYPYEFNYARGVYFYYNPDCLTEHLVTEIDYDLEGHKWTGEGRLNNRDVLTYAKLDDGQLLTVVFHFLDKTVESLNAGQYDNSELLLDPYTEDNITVPNQITINFAEGKPLVYDLTWNVPSDFEVMYDTFQRVFGGDHDKFFAFTSALDGYNGLARQDLLLKVKVADRLFKDYQLISGVTDYYDSYTEPNAFYRYVDPFAGRATDLPQTIDSAYSGGNIYNLVWEFEDSNITANGTMNDGGLVPIYVRGNVYNAERGQPIMIKVYVDRWEFKAIRRPSSNGDYIIMEDEAMRFVISAITGVSSISHYKIDFEITSSQPSANLEKSMVSKIFIPEGVSPSLVDASYGDDYEYRMNWDQEALNRAKSNGEASGYYTLVNKLKSAKFTLSPTIYQYENPNILQIDLGYGMGTQNNAIFVVNPLRPVWMNPDTEDDTVSAIGTYNTEYAISYDEQGLITRVIWDGVNSLTISDGLIGGGVIRDWTIVLELTSKHDPSFLYTQTFDIVLVALDMSPVSYINSDSQSANTLTEAPYKSVYNATTYAHTSNPYKDLYTRLINTEVDRHGKVANVLDTAISDLGMEGGRLTYRVEEWEKDVYVSNNTKTQYSKKVRIEGRVYETNIVKRMWNQVFAIHGLNAGYGLGTDQVRIDTLGTQGAVPIVMVVNPFEPNFGTPAGSDPYVTTVDGKNVTGTYNGQPLSSVGGEGRVANFGFTYTLTWWDRAVNGDKVIFARDQFIGGGVIDYWKVVVTVYDGTSVVYEQVVNVRLVLLDMTPNKILFYSEGDNSAISDVKSSYGANDYKDKENPYGANYASLLSALNSGASNARVGEKTYVYRITWGEFDVCNSIDENGDLVCDNCGQTIEEGKTKRIRNSVEVDVYLEGEATPLLTIYTDLFQTVLIS